MNPLRRFRPTLEALDDRALPSVTLSYFGGSLAIKGTPLGNLAIVGQGGNQFQITDNANLLGNFNLTGNLTVQLASRPGFFNLDLTGSNIGGSVLIDLGNGLTGPQGGQGDDVDVFDRNATSVISTGTGQIMGNLSIQKGNGQERLFIGARFAPSAGFFSLPVTVRGNVSVVGKAAANTADSLAVGDGTMIRGSFTSANIDAIQFGKQYGPIAGQATVLGDVSISNTTGVGPGLQVSMFGRFDRSVTVNAAATTSAFNSFTLAPPDNNVNGTVGGALNVTMRQAAQGNTFNVLKGTVGTETEIVNGVATLTSAGGQSTVPDQFTVQTRFNGALNIAMGEGDNNIDFAPSALVFGNMTLTGGNGSNNFADSGNNGVSFAGSVNGKLNITFGSGDNNSTINGAGGISQPMAITGLVGQKLTWRSGNGSNYVLLGDGDNQNYNVDMLFGSGDDTFELNLGAAGIVTGINDGGGGTNLEIIDSGTEGPPYTRLNWLP